MTRSVVWCAVILMCGASGLATAEPRDAVDGDLAHGRVIYLQHCQECHGSEGKGDGPRAPLLAPKPGNLVSAATSRKSDEELLNIIEQGVPRTAMRGWADRLSLQEISQVVRFVRSLIRFRPASSTPRPPDVVTK